MGDEALAKESSMFNANFFARPRPWLSLWVVLSLALLSSTISTGYGGEPPRVAKTSVGPDLVAQVEQELARLKAQAEKEPGPDWPRPSTRVAYLLLAGLAADGSPLSSLTEAEQLFFGVEKHGGGRGILLEVTPDVRVALVDRWIQDKSGTFLERGADLFVREGGNWIRKGSGTAIGKE